MEHDCNLREVQQPCESPSSPCSFTLKVQTLPGYNPTMSLLLGFEIAIELMSLRSLHAFE